MRFLLFKYISCYCLSVWKWPAGHRRIHSNTSHVIVYRSGHISDTGFHHIQIHLMLLFIYQIFRIAVHDSGFKYISCYCLSLMSSNGILANSYSNTSHVIVYLANTNRHIIITRIQIHLMLLFIEEGEERASVILKFKYISCYCLSNAGEKAVWDVLIQIHLMLLFISPLAAEKTTWTHIQIHLMLLFIPRQTSINTCWSGIQIHLMLLFIFQAPGKPAAFL